MVNQLCNSYWLVSNSLISRQGVFPGLIRVEGFLSEKYVHFPNCPFIHSASFTWATSLLSEHHVCTYLWENFLGSGGNSFFIGIHVYRTVISSIVGTSCSGSWMLVYKFDEIIDVLFLVNRIASFSFCFRQAMPLHSFPE